jgi:hypothetical protein
MDSFNTVLDLVISDTHIMSSSTLRNGGCKACNRGKYCVVCIEASKESRSEQLCNAVSYCSDNKGNSHRRNWENNLTIFERKNKTQRGRSGICLVEENDLSAKCQISDKWSIKDVEK